MTTRAQWNAGVDRERGVVTVGVNLEGMEYRDWPIARFIEAEQVSPRLPAFARTYEDAASAELWFSRDAWQFASRLDILEQHFGPEPPLMLVHRRRDSVNPRGLCGRIRGVGAPHNTPGIPRRAALRLHPKTAIP